LEVRSNVRFESTFETELEGKAVIVKYTLIYEVDDNTFDVKNVIVDRSEYDKLGNRRLRSSYINMYRSDHGICVSSGVIEGTASKVAYLPGVWICFKHPNGYEPLLADYEKLAEISSIGYLRRYLEDLKDYISEISEEMVGTILNNII